MVLLVREGVIREIGNFVGWLQGRGDFLGGVCDCSRERWLAGCERAAPRCGAELWELAGGVARCAFPAIARAILKAVIAHRSPKGRRAGAFSEEDCNSMLGRHEGAMPADAPTTPADNEVSPRFLENLDEIRRDFFSRDPEKWPVFQDPGIRALYDFRRQHHEMGAALEAYPEGGRLRDELAALGAVPAEWSSPDGGVDPLLLFTTTLSKNWEDPAAVENVICQASDPAIYGTIMGTVANPNLVYQEYSGMAGEMEKAVVRQIASLAGYDPEQATGVFTQGGTFCNMYGYLFGLRKSLPASLEIGLEGGQDYRILNSQGGHYSNTTNLSVLGVNLAKKSIRIKITDDNDIDLADLESQLEACFRLNCVVPTIMLTMGTTDTFGVDRVKPVHEVVERLCAHFEISVRPHIHVDAAVGWPLIFFLDYDFEANSLEINAATLSGIMRHVERFRELKYADSFTVDFQKWGFVPYTSSLVMVRNRDDMKVLEHDPENFSYFENDVQGATHLQSTIECSRGAAGMFGAYAGLHYLGKAGYQMLIAHGLQNANYFRARLREIPGVQIVAAENRGPSVAFRMYDPGRVSDPAAEFAYEQALTEGSEYRARVEANTAYHRQQFLGRGKRHLYTNWVEFITHTDYDARGRWNKIPGEKAVFMNPGTDRAQIDAFIEAIKGER